MCDIVRDKTRSLCGTVVESMNREPVDTISNHSVGKKKVSHRSNHNNTIINPFATELNT